MATLSEPEEITNNLHHSKAEGVLVNGDLTKDQTNHNDSSEDIVMEDVNKSQDATESGNDEEEEEDSPDSQDDDKSSQEDGDSSQMEVDQEAENGEDTNPESVADVESSVQNDEEESQSSGDEEEKTSQNGEASQDDDEDDSEIVQTNGAKPKDDKATEADTIELNESDNESDVMIVDAPKTNGSTEVIDSPGKKCTEKEESAPRRSSRNINKNRSYADREESPPRRAATSVQSDDESDVEEVVPQDPLAVNDQITVERVTSTHKKQPLTESSASATIVVKDTKSLVEIATKSSQNSAGAASGSGGGKKEPTLVIIDTNSLLTSKGRNSISQAVAKSAANFASNLLPIAVPAQGMYPANMRATITPITVTKSSSSPSAVIATSAAAVGQAPLLPTLTDDMYVVEAPSFIVPYVYEKPPEKVLKEFVSELKKTIQDEKKKTKKDKKDDDSDASSSSDEESDDDKVICTTEPEIKKSYSYFESPLGKFFMDIGFNMVQEYVQSDLLKQQKRKREREQGANPETNKTIASLIKNIEMSKGSNEHFKMEIKKCEFCNFKTESKLAMAYHLETPHMKNFVYKCNFCSYEVRSPHDILFHMEAEHAVRGHLERAPAFHQCPSCPFEDNQKGKLSRHLVVCARKFKPDRNLEPPADWEPPAKIPRMPKMRATGLNATVAAYQTLAANKGAAQQYQFLSKMQLQANSVNAAAAAASALNRGRGRPTLGPNVKTQPVIRPQGMIFKQQSGGQVLVPTNYQLSGNQVFQVVGGSELGGRLAPVPAAGMAAFVPSAAAQTQSVVQTGQVNQQQKKPSNTPSISITPLPRTAPTTAPTGSKPGDTSSKNSFVICEICDGYIKDLEQLRNHMQWIHKIKIHPKMIYNRPPLNCQKCQFRFFTDQGLERHLLGSHGLVTSSMQDAANKSKDSGRCPVCGRVYQWKLLNHVARDHNMTLKPAHLSYKCTVCTATFGMYKQFENHVYSAHSVVAKRVMDKKGSSGSTSTTQSNNQKVADLKPLKINDEITIIPQPAKSTNGAKEGGGGSKSAAGSSKSGR